MCFLFPMQRLSKKNVSLTHQQTVSCLLQTRTKKFSVNIVDGKNKALSYKHLSCGKRSQYTTKEKAYTPTPTTRLAEAWNFTFQVKEKQAASK